MSVFCNNKMCPYDDCDLKWKHQIVNEGVEKPTVIDLQSSCKRLTQYLANKINSLMIEEQGK